MQFLENAGGRLATKTVAQICGHAGHVAVGHVAKALVVALGYQVDERLRVDGQALEHLARVVSDRAAGIGRSPKLSEHHRRDEQRANN